MSAATWPQNRPDEIAANMNAALFINPEWSVPGGLSRYYLDRSALRTQSGVSDPL